MRFLLAKSINEQPEIKKDFNVGQQSSNLSAREKIRRLRELSPDLQESIYIISEFFSRHVTENTHPLRFLLAFYQAKDVIQKKAAPDGQSLSNEDLKLIASLTQDDFQIFFKFLPELAGIIYDYKYKNSVIDLLHKFFTNSEQSFLK
jgi:hypothetical protein